ncbi:MAG: PilZ domain-containing protein [Nitrospirota bacterium]
MFYKGSEFEASTFNLSESGLGIEIPHKFSIPTGDIASVSIGNYHGQAQIAWIVRKTDFSVALVGLKILDRNTKSLLEN